jgi:adenine C2-methylase RlmN of 23S rRNA A2503 and tRNA A37
MTEDFELFPGKSLSGLFKDIYDNQIQKKQRISELIADMRKIIRHAGDMVTIGPIIKDLVDSSVRNDDALIKLATIAQRIVSSNNKNPDDSGFLTEKEKLQLLEDFEKTIKQATDEQESRVDGLEHDIEELKIDKKIK